MSTKYFCKTTNSCLFIYFPLKHGVTKIIINLKLIISILMTMYHLVPLIINLKLINYESITWEGKYFSIRVTLV